MTRRGKDPAMVHHKARNAAVVNVRGPDGKRRQIYLGRWDSEQAVTNGPLRRAVTPGRCDR